MALTSCLFSEAHEPRSDDAQVTKTVETVLLDVKTKYDAAQVRMQSTTAAAAYAQADLDLIKRAQLQKLDHIKGLCRCITAEEFNLHSELLLHVVCCFRPCCIFVLHISYSMHDRSHHPKSAWVNQSAQCYNVSNNSQRRRRQELTCPRHIATIRLSNHNSVCMDAYQVVVTAQLLHHTCGL